MRFVFSFFPQLALGELDLVPSLADVCLPLATQ